MILIYLFKHSFDLEILLLLLGVKLRSFTLIWSVDWDSAINFRIWLSRQQLRFCIQRRRNDNWKSSQNRWMVRSIQSLIDSNSLWTSFYKFIVPLILLMCWTIERELRRVNFVMSLTYFFGKNEHISDQRIQILFVLSQSVHWKPL